MSFDRDFADLRAIGADPAGGWSRLAFSDADIAAHDWLMERGRAAGLQARMDGFGNVVLRLEGEGPAIALVSHLDSVRNGGSYDGALGVLAGLEVARRIAREGTPGRPVEVIAFRDEEGRFGPFMGSRAMAGLLDAGVLAQAKAADGSRLSDAMAAAGLVMDNAPRDWSQVAACIELHIEQGPVLEDAGVPLGIVTAIVGQERLSIRVTGQPDHAGAAPMSLRRDAFAGAAEFATRFEALVRGADDHALRGTIGVVKLSPNQANVVPGEVTLALEIRSTDAASLIATRDAIECLATEVARDRGLGLRLRRIWSDAPVPMDAGLQDQLAESAIAQGHAAIHLPSGANHDSGIIGRIVPAAMLFVPSKGGRSHCPEEETAIAQIEAAIDVLHHATVALRQRTA